MPSRRKSKSGASSRGRASTRGSRSIDTEIVKSSVVVGVAENVFPPADLEAPIPNWDLVQRPPSLRNNITWVQGKLQNIVTVSNSVPTETNIQFRLSDLVDLVGLAGFFDQYCIYAATVSVHPSFEGAGSTLYTFGSIVTAIDYDNVGALGSFDAVASYQSSHIFEMSPGQAVQRFIKPCVAPALYAAGGTFSGYGVKRLWVDSAVTTVPHYGFRSIAISNTVSGLSLTFDVDLVLGFRNNM
jgi:hypothetical protein